MLQCVVVCCSVLHCVVERPVSQLHEFNCLHVTPMCVAECCSVLQCVAVYCSVVHCVAVCCSVLQCVAVCCSVLRCVECVVQQQSLDCTNSIARVSPLCVLQRAAVRCSVLPCVLRGDTVC